MNTEQFNACALALNFLARLLLEAPAHEFLIQIKETRIFDQWPLPARAPSDADALEFLQTYFNQYTASGQRKLATEYTVLFIGPANAIPLWESVWTTEDRLLFDGPMFDVRKQYETYGLTSPNSGYEPDDHIGLEMAFLGGVMGCAADALENGDAARAREHAAVARGFWESHLSLWAYQFMDTVAGRAEADFYRAVASLCQATLCLAEKLFQDAGTKP